MLKPLLLIKDTGEELDDLFDEAVRVCLQYHPSSSLLQRKLQIGYARAARLLDQLEASGVVSPQEGIKPIKVLIIEENKKD